MSNQKNVNEAFDSTLAEEMVKRTQKVNDTTIDLVERLRAAREFIAWSAVHVRSSWLEWQDSAATIIRDLNQDRMAIDLQSKAMVAAGKDVRDFFNSPEYLKAHATMTEMLHLLERLRTMKQDGTLDAFSDFVLKISCK